MFIKLFYFETQFAPQVVFIPGVDNLTPPITPPQPAEAPSCITNVITGFPLPSTVHPTQEQGPLMPALNLSNIS